MFFLFLVFPYIAGFLTLAFWRNWWMFGIATVAMLALYGYFASRPPALGPGVAFLADFIPIPLGLGIAAGAISSIVFMATKCRFSYASALIFALGAFVLAKLLGAF